jgi:hypothetical protein
VNRGTPGRGPGSVLAALAALVLGALPAAAGAADYSFDPAEVEARPYEVSGFVEGRAEHFELRPDASLYPLSFPGQPPRETLDRGTASFELAGKLKHDMLTGYARASGSAARDAFGTTSTARLLEGGLRVSPLEGLSFDVGKQVQRWGKGYAWSPVAFFERPKDANDPQNSLEGFVMASADWVRSRPGPLAAVGFTPLLLPVTSDVNRDYGATGHVNVGARLYLLYEDTDIDLLWAAEGSRPQRLGVDFSRNLGTQLEVHGEWARSIGATRRILGADGVLVSETQNLDSWLVGARYMTESEVTWITELYRNGTGFDETQLAAFYRLLDQAFSAGGGARAQALAQALAQSGYGRVNPGRSYAYLRVSAKDPFDWLYVNPALTLIANLDDRSWQLTPELLYTGWQNVELRARAVLLQGDPLTEYGAKPFERRLELRLRLYF